MRLQKKTGRVVCGVSLHTQVYKEVEKWAGIENRTISNMIAQLTIEAIKERQAKVRDEVEA
ncbi:MAG: hypothetical protein M0R74_17175 [Dehalococcoidia bacterium]|jgi:hypothetical protein|nr:hypothetical protein [Dehalococcoidia bacterium]